MNRILRTLLLTLVIGVFVQHLNAQGWIGLTARNTAVGNAQESYIIINPEATCGFDLMFDLKFLPGIGPRFYSLADNEKLSTNSLPNLTAETEISFVFVPNEGDNYQIEASGLELIETPVYLYDRKVRSDQNLSRNPVYSFVSVPGDDSTRFLLHFAATGIDDKVKINVLYASYYDKMLHFNNLGTNDIVIISDMQGRKLKEIRPGTGNMHAYPIQLPSGIYLFRQISGKESFVSKILVH